MARSSIYKSIEEAFDAPVYVLRKTAVGHAVEKLEVKKRKVTDKKRYLLNGNQCSCIAFMKNATCKHLQMLNGSFGGTGVPATVAYTEAVRVHEKLGSHFPVDAATWLPDPEKLPTKVDVITFKLTVEGKVDGATIYVVREFPVGTLVLKFELLEKAS